MMYAALYRYLVTYQQLPVPGIGTFHLDTIPATSDFPNKLLYPPSYRVRFDTDSRVPAPYFFRWLAASLAIPDREAVFRFNDFAFEMKKQISEGCVISWKAMGTLQKGLGGEIKFSPEVPELILQQPVPAEKIIRENTAHRVRVGEEDKSSTEMTALLQQSPAGKKDTGMVIALILLLLSVLFTGWHLSENGVRSEAAASTRTLGPASATGSYQLISE